MNKKPISDSKDHCLDFIKEIINRAISDRATDIHWEPQVETERKELVVRFRIDGLLRDVDRSVNSQIRIDSIMNAIKIMGSLDPTKRRRQQDGRFTIASLSGDYYDVRLATMPTIVGEKIAMRIMDRSLYSAELSALGMSEEFQNKLQTVLARPEGFIVVVGPTGSGKTTTLYVCLQKVYSRQKNLCTIEDPVECRFVGMNQIQVEYEFGMTFVAGLRSIMRQDPDIIAVGEIRDAETARTALQAALAGSSVFSTFHAKDAIHSIVRLFDMGVEPYFIASALSAVVAQRLVRLTCKICKGKGCSQCKSTGFKKRIGIFELLTIDDKLRGLILQRASADQLREVAGSNLLTFQVDIDRLMSKNLTTQQEINRVFAVE
ncbi:GspE/PulE family protein [Candidatus Omnitrophota bacterium]